MKRKILLILGCLVLPGIGNQSLADDLVFTPITPCRIIDTRVPGTMIDSILPTNFVVTGTSGFEAQGGQTGGCGNTGSCAKNKDAERGVKQGRQIASQGSRVGRRW